MQSLNQRITEARKALGMTQEQVAEAMNVSRQTVSHWEKGRIQPDEATAKRLFALLNITPDEPAQGKPADNAWKLIAMFFCGVLATVLVIYGIVPMFTRDAQPAADILSDEAFIDAQHSLLPADYPSEWYQKTADNVEGKAYVKLTALQSPVKLTAVEDAPLPYEWNIVFTFEEVNGIPFTVTRMTEVFFDSEGGIVDPWVMGSEEFAGFFQESTLVPGKNYSYNLSCLISPYVAWRSDRRRGRKRQ